MRVERLKIPSHSRPFSPPIIWLASHFFPISAVTWIWAGWRWSAGVGNGERGQTTWRKGVGAWTINQHQQEQRSKECRGFIKMCSANPLVDTVMNSQAHCQGKLLHYTMAQWSLISLGGQHPGGSPDQRMYSGLEVPISLVIQSVTLPSLSLPLSLSLFYYIQITAVDLFIYLFLQVLFTLALHHPKYWVVLAILGFALNLLHRSMFSFKKSDYPSF